LEIFILSDYKLTSENDAGSSVYTILRLFSGLCSLHLSICFNIRITLFCNYSNQHYKLRDSLPFYFVFTFQFCGGAYGRSFSCFPIRQSLEYLCELFPQQRVPGEGVCLTAPSTPPHPPHKPFLDFYLNYIECTA
jgi:hypothetical protein